ncbi:MAG: gamma-glutamyltransferase family protein [Chromatiales bacterium]|jgi:gamma-glutamyltranspeptidase / glutathione hydrolase|nr:gamma-glutamyltransferase family protein [Chromatiales bacterium]
MPTMRPEIKGTQHVVSTGHNFSSQAAFQILENGGNAIDAGVCAGIALGILQSDLVSIGGVAPIIVYVAETQEIVTISGLGWWPRKASVEYFQRQHNGAIPSGIMRTVVPAAPDAWITALSRWGTLSFADVSAAAIRFARDGFPMNHLLRSTVANHLDEYREFPAHADIFLRNDQPYEVGEIFRQTEAAAALQYMVDQERSALANGATREQGLKAARRAFYKGDIARTIADYHAAEGGWMTMEDLAEYKSEIEAPETVRFGDVDVYSCGPWCQGPALLQALNLIEGYDLTKMGHNSPQYIHTLTEAIKLVMADRDCYYSDPRFVDVPMKQLLEKDYSANRAKMIDDASAWLEMPPAGDWQALGLPSPPPVFLSDKPEAKDTGTDGAALDTTYLCVVDKAGNVFSATPSDGSYNGGIVPGLGFVVSGRGTQSWTDPNHPCVLAPGKRPRLTPNPAIAIQNGERFVPLGTPGGDVQIQAMLQTLLNLFVFGMGPQEAVEAPRFASYSFPNSFEPHDYHPGLLKMESRIDEAVGKQLAAMGHRIEWWPDVVWLAGSICMIDDNRATGLKLAGADPRRMAYALGW